MSSKQWAKHMCELAVALNPKQKKIYDVALSGFESMCDDGHSGMSWSLSVSVANEAFEKMMSEAEESWKSGDIFASLDAAVEARMKKEAEIESEWDGYIKLVCMSARKAVTNMSCHVSSVKQFSEVMEVFNKLVHQVPLVEITEENASWNLVTEDNKGTPGEYTTYQSGIRSALFKDVYSDGTVKYHDVDRSYTRETIIDKETGEERYDTYGGSTDRIVDLLYPLTLPWTPSVKKYVVNVERVEGDKEMLLYKSIDLPDGTVRMLNYPVVAVDRGYVKCSYSEYLTAKAKYGIAKR